ncbi:protein SUO [Citrus sinensis]|uniref:Protein SUO n=1 Tax=Citrus sinensis TaxID=2711 RepID=A0ACB8LR62_CITSI|nr:protein SUO [Citrus sinensis]
MCMHRWQAGEAERKRAGRHMWTVPTRSSVAGDDSFSSSNLADSFYKDGRKISVGDCALFKPLQDSPPFIGIIRSLTSGRENNLKLCVNWLYRPAEVKLGKGILLEAAPNEIFHSFHKDEIPAASLLHPCKVAFLPKGFELPSRICSFERQEEVDQLLYKTRIEMHATMQQGGRSPKPLNGPTSTSQLKPSSDSVQNSVSSFPSQVKGKKRERGDQGSEPVKKERSTKMDDRDSGHGRSENVLRSEISKITENGGLVDFEGVEKFIQLMVPDRNERKIDLVCRSMLAGVVAAADKFDCLSKFVQVKGLHVFDEWLQEVHKGKIGDGSNPKDGDKAIEEFPLVSLRALDKLPKKARSLVDTWKKRVEAEMNAKSGSNQAVSGLARPRIPEVSHGGNRNSGSSSEIAIKSSSMQLSTSKTASVKLVQGETVAKPASACASPTSTKSAPSPASGSTNLKDGQLRNTSGTSDLPSTPTRDEKSSSSSQSHNNSQSCSSDHAKTGGFSRKEDARSSTAGSMTVNKISGGSSWPRKISQWLSQYGLIWGSNGSRVVDMSVVEGNSHKLIVKIPNQGRSPAQSAYAVSLKEPSVMNSRASSPVPLDKHDRFDRNFKEKSDDGSPATIPDEEQCRAGDDPGKTAEVSKTASSSSKNELKSGKSHNVSFRSINALIESCVKYSEAKTSVVVGDDAGMNLLASVAAEEISKSDVVSLVGSPRRKTPVYEPFGDENDSRVKSFPGDQFSDGTGDVHGKLGVDHTSWAKNGDSNQEKPAGDLTGLINTSHMDLQQSGDPCQENIGNSNKIVMTKGTPDCAGKNPEDDKAGVRVDTNGTSDDKQRSSASLSYEDKVSELNQGVECNVVDGSLSHPYLEFHCENKKTACEGLKCFEQTEQKPSLIATHAENVKCADGELLHESGPGKDMASKNIDEVKDEKVDEVDSKSNVNYSEEQKSDWKSNTSMGHDRWAVSHVSSAHSEDKGEHVEENLEGKEIKEQCFANSAPLEASTALGVQETDYHVKTEAPKLTASGGFDGDEGKYGESSTLTGPACSGSVQQLISPLPLPISSVTNSLPSLITMTAAAKGPFVPLEDLLRSKGALGWKGSAATSAFRPAEPRKILEMPLGVTNISVPDSTSGKLSRSLLDIDLNVPDERVLEDLASRSSAQDTVTAFDHTNNRDGSRCEVMGSTSVRGSGGLDLDLNRAEELIDINNYSTSNGNKTDVLVQTGTSSGGLSNGEVNVYRDFDLNDGPVDDMNAEPTVFHQHPRNVQAQAPISGLRIILPDRGEQPFPFAPGVHQRMLAPSTSGSPFSPNVFRGPVLSSSPAVPFPSTPFQYPVFPFGSSFPLPSATFSVGSTTYVDSSSMSISDGSNSASAESSSKWGRQVLDLNVGPGVPDIEGRNETPPFVPRQLSVAGAQVLLEDQARMYQMAGGHLKRRELEGGWDGYKRPSWH